MDNIFENLKKSPLFNLSLSSKELFHSNFLAWIANTYPTIFSAILEDLGCGVDFNGDCEVRREYENFDLCILKGGKVVFVLENKVKSIPKLSQLEEYSKKEPDAEKVLLSLATEFPNKNAIININWKITNYRNLKEAIEVAVSNHPEISINSYNKAIIQDYCDFIGNLHALASTWAVDDDSKFLLKDEYCGDSVDYNQKLNKLRIADLRDKLWHSQLIEKLQRELSTIDNINIKVVPEYGIKEIKEDKGAPLKKVFINWGFTHGQGLIEAKVKINQRYVLLIQVQGDRYCHGIEWIKAGSQSHEKFWEETKHDDLVRKLSFFQFDEEAALFPGIFGNVKMTPMYRKAEGKSRIYNKYGDRFLYQSTKIEGQTVNAIIHAVKEDIQKIINSAISLKSN